MAFLVPFPLETTSNTSWMDNNDQELIPGTPHCGCKHHWFHSLQCWASQLLSFSWWWGFELLSMSRNRFRVLVNLDVCRSPFKFGGLASGSGALWSPFKFGGLAAGLGGIHCSFSRCNSVFFCVNFCFQCLYYVLHLLLAVFDLFAFGCRREMILVHFLHKFFELVTFEETDVFYIFLFWVNRQLSRTSTLRRHLLRCSSNWTIVVGQVCHRRRTHRIEIISCIRVQSHLPGYLNKTR